MTPRPLEYYINYYGCWIISSHKPNDKGYVHFIRKGIKQKFHRYMYEKHIGKIPDKILVCHKCDNKRCGNPEHLFLGTHKDNAQDALKKNRLADTKGEANGRAQITEETAKEIKFWIEQGIYTAPELAMIMGVSIDVVKNIKSGKTWKYLEVA